MKLRSIADTYGQGLLLSYSQIFFSNSKILGVILLAATFFDINAGIAGIISIILAQLFASWFHFEKAFIKDGMYTYNCLMVGLAIGVYYDFNISFFLLLIIAALMTFFLTIWLANVTSRQNLPFLSMPFLIGVWAILLGGKNFSALKLKFRGFYTIADLPKYHNWFDPLENWINALSIPDPLIIFLKSLGAIFFQYNILAGLLVALGILIYSRIAFVLAFTGFIIGYGFYFYFEGNFSQLIYSYIGFNFILTAIALGGFFVVPSRKSFLLVILAIPIIALVSSATHSLLITFNLPLYSLPFNLVVFLVLMSLGLRTRSAGLDLVVQQQFSPDQNHYKHFIRLERFKSNTLFHIQLPFMGEWFVSQGHQGDVTHRGEWAEAWDFDVRDPGGKSFRDPGTQVKDYYAYDLPVLAPADGQVVEVLDGIPDNPVGEQDLDNNWGNTIIIKHGDMLYSKISHVKNESFKVGKGEVVKKGDVIGLCGNSGRSPEPHLHFQLQSTPYIGSKTLSYPVSYYLSRRSGQLQFHSFEVPEAGEFVSNIRITPLLEKAFKFQPGQMLHWSWDHQGKQEQVSWEVFTDAYKYNYIYCQQSGSYAYFMNDQTMFYFTDFSGSKRSLLYHFYLAAQKILLGYYPEISWRDKLLIHGFFNPVIQGMHDITAPFFHYCRADFEASFTSVDDSNNPKALTLSTLASARIFHQTVRELQFEIELAQDSISSLKITESDRSSLATCVIA